MGVSVRVEGVDRCIGIMDMMSTNVVQAIEQEVDAGAKEMQQRERSLAPLKTGALRKSIINRKGKYGISRMVRAKAPHAPLQEFGTKRGVKPKYFAKRAKEQLLPGIEAKIREVVIKEVGG